MKPVTRAPPAPPYTMPTPPSSNSSPAWATQWMCCVAFTCITKTSEPPWLVSILSPNLAVSRKEPVTRAPPAPSCVMPTASSDEVPPTCMAQSTSPDAVTCITKASELPRLMRGTGPNDASPMKRPATRAPPSPSYAMPLPASYISPPAWIAQSMTPDAVTCITKESELPRLWSHVEPNVTLPIKSPVTKAPPAPS